MKKLFALAIAAVMTLGAAAENWYAGGGLGFNRDVDDNNTEFTIAPEVGYNLGETWAVGATLAYKHSYNLDEDFPGAKWNGFGINPYVRYSFYNNDNVKLFCDGGFGVEFGKWDGKGNKTGVNYEFGFKPGFAYNLNEKFALVAHVGYLGYKGRNDYGTNHKEGGLALKLKNVELGFYVNF